MLSQHINAPINVLPHPPPCGQTLGIGGDLPTFKDIASPLGQITKVKLHPIPSIVYGDLLHSSYSHDSQVRLAGEIPSLGAHFFGESPLNPHHTPAGE